MAAERIGTHMRWVGLTTTTNVFAPMPFDQWVEQLGPLTKGKQAEQ